MNDPQRIAELSWKDAEVLHLRNQIDMLRHQLDEQANRDRVLNRLHDGTNLRDSFTHIASTVASQTNVDRVILLNHHGGRFTLIASSTAPNVDRRSRQVRLLQRLTRAVLSQHHELTFVLGSGSEISLVDSRPLDEYLQESGCREIHIQSITDVNTGKTIAAIVVERFRVDDNSSVAIDHVLDAYRDAIRVATGQAIARHEHAWGALASRFAEVSKRRKLIVVTSVVAAALLVAFLIPVQLKIPATGRVVAANMRHLYASTDGLVDKVLVQNGDLVAAGDPLVLLRSPKLDLAAQSLLGELATSQTNLDSLLASRTRDRDVNLSAQERVLRSQIEGLSAQLELVNRQQAELIVRSPIDGKIDGWNIEQSLESRPVTHGQFLLDVVSTENGWIVDLEVADREIGYVLRPGDDTGQACEFRLRSDPTRVLVGQVIRIAEVAHLNATGDSVVRVTVPIEFDAAKDFRNGASVVAQIDCGSSSAAFVYFRGIIEWWRERSWQ